LLAFAAKSSASMPNTKNPLMRFRVMHSLLSSGGYYSKKEILEKIKEETGHSISTSLFEKDKQWIIDAFKAPIVYKDRIGYYYSDRNYSPAILVRKLSKDESKALDFAYEALNNLENVDLALAAQEVLLNISGRSAEKAKKKGKRIIYRPPSPAVKGVGWLPVLYDAIENEKAVTIRYYKLQTKETKTHTISPYILRQYNELWYVIAWCAARELTLVFALDRIREIKPANVSYFVDPKFNADEYFKYSFGITHSYYEKPQKVQFWINRDAYYYLEIKPLHHSQKKLEEKADALLMQIEVIISEELVMYLSGLGKKIKVIEPIVLLNKINQ
jgi:predicted DNA-binding transcriptional regulator YafY